MNRMTKHTLLSSLAGIGLGLTALAGFQQPAQAVFGCMVSTDDIGDVDNPQCPICEREENGGDSCSFEPKKTGVGCVAEGDCTNIF